MKKIFLAASAALFSLPALAADVLPVTTKAVANVCAAGSCSGWYAGFGILGDGTNVDRHTPVAVSGLSGAAALAAGMNHTCAVRSDGTVRCWGWNYRGQLGDGTRANRYTPVAVPGL